MHVLRFPPQTLPAILNGTKLCAIRAIDGLLPPATEVGFAPIGMGLIVAKSLVVQNSYARVELDSWQEDQLTYNFRGAVWFGGRYLTGPEIDEFVWKNGYRQGSKQNILAFYQFFRAYGGLRPGAPFHGACVTWAQPVQLVGGELAMTPPVGRRPLGISGPWCDRHHHPSRRAR